MFAVFHEINHPAIGGTYIYLVGGIPTPLKNMSSSNGIIVPNSQYMESHNPAMFQTTNQLWSFLHIATAPPTPFLGFAKRRAPWSHVLSQRRRPSERPRSCATFGSLPSRDHLTLDFLGGQAVGEEMEGFFDPKKNMGFCYVPKIDGLLVDPISRLYVSIR